MEVILKHFLIKHVKKICAHIFMWTVVFPNFLWPNYAYDKCLFRYIAIVRAHISSLNPISHLLSEVELLSMLCLFSCINFCITLEFHTRDGYVKSAGTSVDPWRAWALTSSVVMPTQRSLFANSAFFSSVTRTTTTMPSPRRSVHFAHIKGKNTQMNWKRKEELPEETRMSSVNVVETPSKVATWKATKRGVWRWTQNPREELNGWGEEYTAMSHKSLCPLIPLILVDVLCLVVTSWTLLAVTNWRPSRGITFPDTGAEIALIVEWI